ncbi:MAG: M3 family oligoendopeptidase [Gemmatimonadota bacterium]
MIQLPVSPADLAQASWTDIAPYYEALEGERVDSGWVGRWSRLQEIVEEAGTLALIEYTRNTADATGEEANLRWSAQIFPLVHEQNVRLSRKLIDSGWSEPGMEVTLREFRRDIEIFREENVPLVAQAEELIARYQKITGGLEVDWEGERKTIPQLQPYLKVHDRAIRERAFRLGSSAYLARREDLSSLFDEMFDLRARIASNAGFGDYMSYAFAAKYRFDYTPDDCGRFHEAVERTVTPAVGRLMEYRRRASGVAVLRPWDTLVQLEARSPVVPFRNVEELIEPATRVFAALDQELGAWFGMMVSDGLLDLESRPAKAPGGYCTRLAFRGKPFIFMNAVGVPDDVNTLMHESGHCFHDIAAQAQPLIWQRSTGHEAAELASMSMELLVMPHLRRPIGYYDDEAARAVEIEQLEDILTSLAHIASVDAFQRWIYTSGEGADATARDEAWLTVRARFEAGVDWSGLEAERVSRWYRQLHIFELPFYYIEYGIAQLGALQIWRAAQRDPVAALDRYRRFLKVGGTRPLPDQYAEAGARLIFDAEAMGDLVGLVEERLETLRDGGA